MKIILAVFLSAVSLAAYAAPSEVLVFGLPLGGKPSKPIKVCPDAASKYNQICWVSPPFVDSDSRSGMAHLPDAGLPSWAEYASTNLTVEKDGALADIALDIGHIDDQAQILSSIYVVLWPADFGRRKKQ